MGIGAAVVGIVVFIAVLIMIPKLLYNIYIIFGTKASDPRHIKLTQKMSIERRNNRGFKYPKK